MHTPNTAILSLENTLGGRVHDFEAFKACCAEAHKAGMLVHLDGARLWNAIVASGIELHQWFSCVDTMQLCMSKGLGCPMGSLLVCSTPELARSARVIRKAMGGGMRQVGVIAAPIAHVLASDWKAMLRRDHALAEEIVRGVNALGLPEVDEAEATGTNVIWIRFNERLSGPRWVAIAGAMDETHNIKIRNAGYEAEGAVGAVRLVTHRDIEGEPVATAGTFCSLLKAAFEAHPAE